MCFKVFDVDGDGRLSRAEFLRAVELLLRVQEENTLPGEGGEGLNPATLVDNDLKEFGKEQASMCLAVVHY